MTGSSHLDRWKNAEKLTSGAMYFYIKAMGIKHMGWGFRKVFLALVWIIPFLLVDVLYNIFVATYVFGELPKLLKNPKEILLTYRLKRMVKEGASLSQVPVVIEMASMLNRYDPGHI